MDIISSVSVSELSWSENWQQVIKDDTRSPAVTAYRPRADLGFTAKRFFMWFIYFTCYFHVNKHIVNLFWEQRCILYKTVSESVESLLSLWHVKAAKFRTPLWKINITILVHIIAFFYTYTNLGTGFKKILQVHLVTVLWCFHQPLTNLLS